MVKLVQRVYGVGDRHIHLMLSRNVGALFEREMHEAGFYNADFMSPNPFKKYTVPVRHFTFVTRELSIFRERWKFAVELCEKFDCKGWIDGEFLESSNLISVKGKYDPLWKVPFHMERSPVVEGEKRRTELHFSGKRKGSNRRAWRTFSDDMRMNTVVMLPNLHDCSSEIIIVTLQGDVAPIRLIKKLLLEQLPALGGMGDVIVDEEILLRQHFLPGFSHRDLSPLVHRAVSRG